MPRPPQIKELRNKLDEAVAENSQMREFLSPTALQTTFTNALQAAKESNSSNPNQRSGQHLFGVSTDHPSYRLVLMVPQT